MADQSGTCARFKYLGKIHELPLPRNGVAIHDSASTHFGIPMQRMKLVLKGKAYDRNSSRELVAAHVSSGHPIMVIGTQASEQLDSTQNRVKAGRKTAVVFLTSLPGLLLNLISSVILFCWLFVKSMFVKAPARQVGQAPLQPPGQNDQWQEID
jgi:hypothetical protein